MRPGFRIEANRCLRSIDEYRTIAVHLKGDTVVRLDVLAVQTDWSVDELINLLLEQALECVSIERNV